MSIVLLYLTSGLFLGWSLGANDAANVFGTAVGSRMIRFGTAAVICSVCVIVGSVVGGSGAASGLGQLGAVNALSGSFTVALSAALTVYWMTRAGLPVSTSQAIVGGIIGWNLFSNSITDPGILARIVATWIACPIIGAVISASLYWATVRILRWRQPHLLRRDAYTRWGLILAGAFGAFSLGANNIANVMGVFVEASPFGSLAIGGRWNISGTQQLFLLGGIAIAIGVFTYSRRVMMTVGQSIIPLNPIAAWVVVVSHSLVLVLFSSTTLQAGLRSAGLPTIPLIPVSSSQAVIGAVLGIALIYGRGRAWKQIHWGKIGQISAGWAATPVVACLMSFLLLFVMQNVFGESVYRPIEYVISADTLRRLDLDGVEVGPLRQLEDERTTGAVRFRDKLRAVGRWSKANESLILDRSTVRRTKVTEDSRMRLQAPHLTAAQIAAVGHLAGRRFQYVWQLAEALAEADPSWRLPPGKKSESLRYLIRVLDQEASDEDPI